MLAVLQGTRQAVSHAVMKGSATEENWRVLLQDYLPARYQVSTGKIMDSKGSESEQIDVAIIDRQYSPLLFESGGATYIPAESVYCIFEVKQDLNLENVEYAAKKVASVRRLHRTSAPITHAGGEYEPRDPFRIMGGILTTQSLWDPPFGKPLVKALSRLSSESQIDLGCALADGVFTAGYGPAEELEITRHDATTSLVAMIFELLTKLRPLGTVTAIDYKEYLEGAQRTSLLGPET